MTKPAGGATPSRNTARNNYAMPHTPIASAKRPRSSMDKSMLNKNNPGAAAAAAASSAIPSTPLGKFSGGNDDDRAPHTPSPSDMATTPEGAGIGAGAGAGAGTRTGGRTGAATPRATTAMDRAPPLSPMHPARPKARPDEEATEVSDGVEGGQGASKLVDVIFSPMLKFLSGGEGDEEGVLDEGDEEEHRAELQLGGSVSHDLDEVEEEHEDVVADMPQQQLEDQEDAVIVEADDGSSQGSEVEDEEEFNPYAFIKSLPRYEEVMSMCPATQLPAKDEDAPPISLVLDLDETLVHCTVEAVDDADLTFPVEFHGMTYQVYVRLRPHLNEFLKAIAEKFEVIVFTASQQVYADALLDLIDPEQKYIKHRMFRESCLSVEGNFLKDLNVLGRDLTKSVLVDNSPHAFGYQVDNGIPIESWFDDRNDTELLKLERFLRTLHGVNDVRSVVRRTFQTHKLIAQAPC